MTLRTEAGKRLIDGMDESQFALGDWASRVSAIESEARAAALREVAEKVNGLVDTFNEATQKSPDSLALRAGDALIDGLAAILTDATGASE